MSGANAQRFTFATVIFLIAYIITYSSLLWSILTREYIKC